MRRAVPTLPVLTGGFMNFEIDIENEGAAGYSVAIYTSDRGDGGALEFARSGIEGKEAVLQYISDCFSTLIDSSD